MQRGKYVCINLYHWVHLAGFMVPIERWRASSGSWVRNSPSGILLAIASSLLPIRACTSGLEMPVLIAAFRAYCLLHNVKKRAIDWELFQLCVGTWVPWIIVCSRAVIYEYDCLIGVQAKLSLARTRKSLNRTAFIPPRYAEWKTTPLIGDMAKQTVTLRPLWPQTCL